MLNSKHPLASKLCEIGIRQGDAVAILSENSREFAELVLACWRLSAVVMPVSTRYPCRMVSSILGDFNVHFLLTSRDLSTPQNQSFCIDDFVADGGEDWTPAAFDKNDFDLQADASIILTSGSSAKPKAVLHSLGNHYFSALGSHENIPFGPGDTWLASLPMYHISGFSLIMRAWLHGGTLVFPMAKQPLTESVQRYDITHLSVVPTQLMQLLDDPACVRRLKGMAAILLGGASLPLHLIQKAAALELPVYRTYGSTEMASQITTTSVKDCHDLNSSSGCVLRYRQMKLSPEGEILVKGRSLFKGYVAEKSVILPVDDEGFFDSGDIGYLDNENRLHVTGRKDLMFISGGENIHPEEIEKAIEYIESVEQVVVVPIEDIQFGSRPVAFIRTKEGMEFDVNRAKKVLRDRLESFKIPEHFLPWPKEFDSSLKPSISRLQTLAAEMV
jgi:O-succinylbenzoic acid--CoA ligase